MVRPRSTNVKAPEPGSAEDFNVLFQAWLLSRTVSALLDAALAPAGLTADEFGAYSVLAGAESVTPTELARWMAAPPTTVSSYIKRLQSRGHLERTPNPADSRSHRIRLTRAGHRTHRHAAALFAPALDRVLTALGGQEADVRAALRTLRTAVDTARTPDAADPRH